MDFENTLAECIRRGDLVGIKSLCLDQSLVNDILTCQTPVEQISGKFGLPSVDFPTPIVYAILCQQQEIVDEFMILGADLSVFVGEWQPIHYAVGSRNVDITDSMINFNNNQLKYKTKSNGNYPLHISVSSGVFDLVVCLLKAGHDPNVQNNSGNTPLHLAVYAHNTDILSALLAFGAKLDIKNKDGLTPLEVAKQNKLDKSAQYIESYLKKEIPIQTKEEIIAEYEKVPADSQQTIKEKSDLLEQRVCLAEETLAEKRRKHKN